MRRISDLLLGAKFLLDNKLSGDLPGCDAPDEEITVVLSVWRRQYMTAFAIGRMLAWMFLILLTGGTIRLFTRRLLSCSNVLLKNPDQVFR